MASSGVILRRRPSGGHAPLKVKTSAKLGKIQPALLGRLRPALTRRTDQAAVAKRIKEICETRVRYGYRRVHVLLDREGWGVNVKKVYRIYMRSKGPSHCDASPQDGMQLRHKTPKRRVKAKLRDDRVEAIGPNEV